MKVVIVDDEVDVRERLEAMLESIESGFTHLGSYENGIDAYQGVINNPPDLLITDIRIPYINGIDLIRQIKEIEPFIKSIVITGYDELDYAKQAIDLDVIAFISKPVSKEELAKALKRASQKIQSESELNASLTQLKEFQQQNLSVIRENDLCKLITMRSVTNAFLTKLTHEGVNLSYPYMMVGVFDFDQNLESMEMEASQMNLLSVKQNIENQFNQIYPCEIFNRDNQLILIVKSEKEFLQSTIDKYFSYELLRMKRFLQCEVSLGLSAVSYQNHNYKQRFGEAKRALELRRIMGGSKVFFYQSLQDNDSLHKSVDDADFKQLAHLVKYCTLVEINDFLDRLETLLKEPEYHTSYNFTTSMILNTLLQACDDHQILSQQYSNLDQIYVKFSSFKTIDETFAWFKELVVIIKKIDDEIICSAIDQNLKRIKDYIQLHYTDIDLNLDAVSDQVRLSSSYISTLLKKECNLTFVKYLTMLRMEKAKELLNNPILKIIDVAEQVGYNEPYYFSHCFKKYFGVSPKEYRTNETGS